MSDTYTRRRARQMSDQELRLMMDAIVQEQATRRRLDASPEKITRVISEYQQSMGREDGDPWVQPSSALDSYPKGAVVNHDGKLYISTVDSNVWSPGQSGWRLKPETDEDGNDIPPPYVPPTGAHDSYQEGERITWSDGLVYEAVRSGVVHSPDEYAPDWRLIEPEPEPEPEPEEPPEEEGPDPEEPTDPEEPEPGDGDEDEDEDDEPEPDEPALPEWKVGVEYQPGDAFIYDGHEYRVLQTHTSAAHWLPPHLPALYERQ